MIDYKLLKDKVIVSSQAMVAEPFYEEKAMLAMFDSVVQGGAGGLRVAGARDVKNAKKYGIPVIGLTKPESLPQNWKEIVYITPTIDDINLLIDAGADIIAFDGTNRLHKDSLKAMISTIHSANKLAMADISTLEEGCLCADLGADFISTTLCGYTKETEDFDNGKPSFALLEELVNKQNKPVILEGRIWEVEQVKKAFKLGAFSVVIGSAITRPHLITKRFCEYN